MTFSDTKTKHDYVIYVKNDDDHGNDCNNVEYRQETHSKHQLSNKNPVKTE